MRPFRIWMMAMAVACVAGFAGVSLDLTAQSSSASNDTDDGVPMVIEGLVRDAACPMQNHKSTATDFSLKCALACAKSGSPLIILTRDDEIYFPMSDQMPDTSQRERLIPFVGKFVHVTGTVYRRHGTRAIVIKDITEMKDVKLKIE
jgi:hypothetical protein